MNYQAIVTQINQANLRSCGGFHPAPDDALPADIKTAVIIGNAGNRNSSDFWTRFEDEKEATENPLESWTRKTLSRLAKDLGADVTFPFDGPPYDPILTWAGRAEPVYPSPFGAFIHPDFGLWHSYRGVLLFKEKIDLPEKKETPSPCETCAAKPCLTTCPVGAIAENDFDVPACVGFLASSKGPACMGSGCLARRACPVGQDHIYEPAQAEFHLTAFLKTFGPKSPS